MVVQGDRASPVDVARGWPELHLGANEQIRLHFPYRKQLPPFFQVEGGPEPMQPSLLYFPAVLLRSNPYPVVLASD